jgi:imidazole glycerol-phosphate synthase subunit HisF
VLRPRVIPCLLIKDKGLVKTVGFKDPKYVGDPINAVRIFNEKEVDEIMVVEIDATAGRREPDYALIENLAAQCRMPLCYGGGIKTAKQVERIIGLGVEKVALSSVLFQDPDIIREAGTGVGNQSIVAVLDVKKTRAGYEVFTHNGSKATGQEPVAFARRLEELGAGEIVLNSIDNDGRMQGYDLDLIAQVRAATGLPLTCLGGAGSLEHMKQVIERHGAMGVAAGSLFVFKGVFRAVLINYPNKAAKESVFKAALVGTG